MATIRFYLDECVTPAVADGLRRRGVDVLTVQEAGMLGASDDEHLERARSEDRVIATHDDDFLRLHAAGQHHAGILFAPQQTAVGELVRGLMLVHSVLEPHEMIDHVEYL